MFVYKDTETKEYVKKNPTLKSSILFLKNTKFTTIQ